MYTLRAALVWTPEGICPDACVVMHDGNIIEVIRAPRHPESDLGSPPRVDEDLRDTLLVPGFVNAHSHAFQRVFRGHVQWRDGARGDFWSWREAMYAAAATFDPEQLHAVSALCFLEMAEAGFTSVGEFHYLQHDREGRLYADPDVLAKVVIAAARDVGLRIRLLRVAYARAGFDRALEPAQRRFVDRSPDAVLDAVARLSATADPLVTVGLAPHSMRALPMDWLRALSAYDGVIHAHVSEQPAENAASLVEHRRSPLAVFEDAGLLSPRFSAVHLTHPMAGDLDRLAASGGSVVACPTTELDLGDGFLPLEARSLPLAIGTDSHAQIDPFEEARSLELHARGLAGRRVVMAEAGSPNDNAARLLRILTEGGARALDLPVGRIEAGAPADLVAIDLSGPSAFGVPPLEAAIFAGNARQVRASWIGGQRVIAGGRHPARERVMRRLADALPERFGGLFGARE